VRIYASRDNYIDDLGRLLTQYSFMAHPETLLLMPQMEDPVERFVSVVKFYLSGWHIKPPYELCYHFLGICSCYL
jgi:hypothetical protein